MSTKASAIRMRSLSSIETVAVAGPTDGVGALTYYAKLEHCAPDPPLPAYTAYGREGSYCVAASSGD